MPADSPSGTRWNLPDWARTVPTLLSSIPTATNQQEFKGILSENPRAEVNLLLLARTKWFRGSPILGLAQCRRTYCHHLVLEFLSVHPAIVSGGQRVRGVGSSLVNGLAEFAGSAGISVIWGEATAYSDPFCAKTVGLPRIDDHFFIRNTALHRCRENFIQSQQPAA